MEGEAAVPRAVDPDRLLPGEDPRSRNREDAEHWLRVYRELHDFKLDLIEQTRNRLRAMDPAAQVEVHDVDLTILLKESDRLGRRLRFWKTRVEALAPARAR